MMRTIVSSLALLALLGCGGGGADHVKGKVTLDGQPLKNALVAFIPMEGTKGVGGNGVTDADGAFTIKTPRGEAIEPGEYRVVISKFLCPDGSEPDPDVPPIDSDASESLSPDYSDRDNSKLRANVSSEKKDFPFELTKKSQ